MRKDKGKTHMHSLSYAQQRVLHLKVEKKVYGSNINIPDLSSDSVVKFRNRTPQIEREFIQRHLSHLWSPALEGSIVWKKSPSMKKNNKGYIIESEKLKFNNPLPIHKDLKEQIPKMSEQNTTEEDEDIDLVI